jgi:hypothetical protein
MITPMMTKRQIIGKRVGIHSIVINCHSEKCDVYIERPSMWGNPYKVGKDGNIMDEEYEKEGKM